MSQLPLLASSPIFPLTSQTPTTFLEHDEHLGPDERPHCDDLRQSVGSTQTVTPTGYEPKIIKVNVIDSEAISPEDLEPRRIELDRILGTDPYPIHETFLRRYGGKKKSWCRCVLLPVTDAFRTRFSGKHCRLGPWRWRTTKNASFTTVFAESRRLWILSNANRNGETCCIVLIWKRRTGRSIQEFCFQKSWPVKCGKISSWGKQRAFAQSGKIWTFEARTSSWISQWLYHWASATSLCSKIGKGGRPSRFFWISTRTSSSTRSFFLWKMRFSDVLTSEVFTKWEKWRELKDLSWRSIILKNKRNSWDNIEAHFPVAGDARTVEFNEWWGRISRSGIKLQWEIVSRFK